MNGYDFMVSVIAIIAVAVLIDKIIDIFKYRRNK